MVSCATIRHEFVYSSNIFLLKFVLAEDSDRFKLCSSVVP